VQLVEGHVGADGAFARVAELGAPGTDVMVFGLWFFGLCTAMLLFDIIYMFYLHGSV
jgi:hypothetical protein